MASSNDLKEALNQRLNRRATAVNVGPAGLPIRSGMSRMGTFSPQSGSLLNHNEAGKPAIARMTTSSQLEQKYQTSLARPSLGLPTSTQIAFTPRTSVLMPIDPMSSVASIECEGYLAKFSSGSLTGRWQRRYFILQDGRFGYHKKQPEKGSDAKPDKTFSLRKIKAVYTKEPCPAGEREFSLQLGEHTYQLKAGTPSEMRKWLSVLNTALAHKDSFPPEEEAGNDDLSAEDMVSVANSVSSNQSDMSVMSEDVQAYLARQRAQVSRQQETVWEVDVDVDQLDQLFEQWFPTPNEQVKMSIRQINGCIVSGLSKGISHMYAALANEVFDPELIDLVGQFDRVKTHVATLRAGRSKSQSSGGDPIKLQLSSVLMEYVPRMAQVVDKFLEKRAARRASGDDEDGIEDGSSVSDLPAILNALSGFVANIGVIWKDPKEDVCFCAYCDAAGAAASDLQNETCALTDKWRKSLRSLQQRVGSEFEVCLIEAIQSEMLAIESTWDAPSGASSSAPSKISHPLFGNRSGVWLSAWAPSLILACQERAVDLLEKAGSKSRRLISELLASVFVAVLNSAWRQFKRKSMRTNSFVAARKKAILAALELASQSSGFWASFTAGQTQAQIAQILAIPIEEANSLHLANLLAFANEAVLVSLFLTEALTEQLPFIPKIFAACFDGLGATFASSAVETCNHVIYFHFTDTSYGEVERSFAPKSLQAFDLTKKSPMLVCRDLVEKFVNELIPYGAHPSIKAHCINALPFAVVHLYVFGLMKHKPKLKLFKSFLSIFQADLVIFKALFSEQRFSAPDAVVSQALSPCHWILSFLTETDIRILVDDLSPKLAQFFGPKHALLSVSALVEMRGGDVGKSDRAAMAVRVEGAKAPARESAHDPDNLPWRFN